MPNWCQNRVTAYARNGNEQDIKRIQEIFESKDSVFGKIIPSPDWNNTPNEDGELPVRTEHKNPKCLKWSSIYSLINCLVVIRMGCSSCKPDNL